MSLSTPPLVPPPTTSITSSIPFSNKQLLCSIEMGTKLKKVPESVKHDRSSGLLASGNNTPARNIMTLPQARYEGQNTILNPGTNNGIFDFQSELVNQLSSMKGGANNFKERRPSEIGNNNIGKRASRQSLDASSLIMQSALDSVSPAFSMPISPPNVSNQSTFTSTARTAILPSYHQIMRSTPPPGEVNRPAGPLHARSLGTPPDRPSSHSSAAAVHLSHVNNNRASAIGIRELPPPPPPPPKNKPLQRNSFSMDPLASHSPHTADPVLRPRPLSQAPSLDHPSRHCSATVTRTTGNPPPPIPGPFRFPSAPPPSSRALPAPPSASPHILDRAPPPPPPMHSAYLHRPTSAPIASSFDRQFIFPDECQFPRL